MSTTACNNFVGLDMEATGKKVSELIDASGLCDKEIAERMNLSVQSINKWRHGKKLPDIENLFILKQILGVRMDDFFVAVQTQPTYKVDYEAGQDSASVIRRLMAYFTRIQALFLNQRLNDSQSSG